MSSITSEGITPPSSLIRTHAPDQIPPFDFALRCFERSLQVAVSPCWKMALPDIISAILAWLPGPLPRSIPPVLFCPFLPGEHRPHLSGQRFGLLNSLQCNFNRVLISRLQPFLYVQAPMLARPPGCTYRCNLPDYMVARPFTPRIEHVVTQHELWYRYMSESGN